MTRTGKLVVIAGPSGVGKGTIVRHIMENYPGFHLSVSATTRPPRPGEVDGKSYFFVTEEQFGELALAGNMLEWAQVHGKHSYGTPREPVEKALANGLNVLLEIDIQGAFQVNERFPEAMLIFINPPSFEELRARLDARGTESEQEKQIRLETARSELLQAPRFDYTVVNDEVARCAQEVVELIQST